MTDIDQTLHRDANWCSK